MYNKISIIVPVYNSEKSLKELCERLSKSLEALASDFEVFLIDDGSTDSSYIEMCKLHEKDNRVKVIKMAGNFGQQNVIMCGLRYAKGEFIVTIDDDLQNPPEEIAKLLKPLRQGYDVVYGIPSQKKHNVYRNMGTKLKDILFTIICKKPINIKIGSFRAMKKDIAELISRDKTPFVYISAITLKHTKKITDVTVLHEERKYGRSNYDIVKLTKLFLKLFMYYSGVFDFTGDNPRPQYILENIFL